MIVPIEETTMLEAISPLSFPPEFKRRLIRLSRREALSEFPPPELRELYFALAQPELSRSPASTH
jgi:hypothetical protein